jgi:hypothetical protein
MVNSRVRMVTSAKPGGGVMPESMNLPFSKKSVSPSFKMYLLWKFVGIVVGGTAGAILGGNIMVWLLDPAEVWRMAFPPEGIIGAIGGVLVGGTLAGGRIGALGVSLLIGTVAGFSLGIAFQSSYLSGLFLLGAIVGLLIGIAVGFFLEIKISRSPTARQTDHSTNPEFPSRSP